MNGLKTSTLLIAYLLVAVICVVEWQVGTGSSVTNRVVEMLAFVSVLLTALQFDSDDPPRKPWLQLAIAFAFVPMGRAAGYLNLEMMGVPLQHPALIVSNVLYVLAVYNFGRVLRSSGLTPHLRDPENRNALRIGWGLVLTVGVIVIGIVTKWIVEGTFDSAEAWSGLGVAAMSSIADGSVFILGLYLVWLVRPLLGGSVSRPYVLIATGGGIFIILNVINAIEKLVTSDSQGGLVTVIAALGYFSFGLAGMAQSKLLMSDED